MNIVKTYKIPEHLASGYHGADYGICSTDLDGNIIKFAYFSDHNICVDEIGDLAKLPEDEDLRFKQLYREMSALGSVSVGMISGMEFTTR